MSNRIKGKKTQEFNQLVYSGAYSIIQIYHYLQVSATLKFVCHLQVMISHGAIACIMLSLVFLALCLKIK